MSNDDLPRRSDILDMKLRRSEDLCELAEYLGYKSKGRFAVNQFQCNNGAYASSLLSFFDDNPGAMDALRDWVLENTELDENEYDDEEEEEDTHDDIDDE